MVHAPQQLPLAPRPIAAELLSSWLLRVAAANVIALGELLEGFEARYGRVLTKVPIDYGISEAAVMALSRFCRVVPGTIRMLDLRQRASWLIPSMLLRFQNVDRRCPRSYWKRVRYAYCPECLVDQQVIHVRWDWSVSYLTRCAVHRKPLLDGCPSCGEPDPLAFVGADVPSGLRCRSCTDVLVAHDTDDPNDGLQAAEDTYRPALAGAAPALLKKATDREFRRFVEEMFEFLTRILDPGAGGRPASADSFSRRDILDMIAVLILNAAWSSNESGVAILGRQTTGRKINSLRSSTELRR